MADEPTNRQDELLKLLSNVEPTARRVEDLGYGLVRSARLARDVTTPLRQVISKVPNDVLLPDVCDRLIEGLRSWQDVAMKLEPSLYPVAPGAVRSDAPQPGPRLYYPPTRPDFQKLKNRLEREWLPEMCRVLSIDPGELPVIWDADFMYGSKDAAGEDSYVLCEINISSVYPFPDEALMPLAEETLRRLHARRLSR